jgi:hypothetical protein
MPYKYDIFISYKRDVETLGWIKEHIKPLLSTYVGLELGREPVIFCDDQLESGVTWPLDLGCCLGESRMMLSLYTKTYFYSEWCTKELAVMLERERAEGFRTPARREGLVVPAVLHDCETLPEGVASIQSRSIQKCFNVRMRRDSDRAERLADELAELAKPIAKAIEFAPSWRSEWSINTGLAFQNSIRHSGTATQSIVPGFAQ